MLVWRGIRWRFCSESLGARMCLVIRSKMPSLKSWSHNVALLHSGDQRFDAGRCALSQWLVSDATLLGGTVHGVPMVFRLLFRSYFHPTFSSFRWHWLAPSFSCGTSHFTPTDQPEFSDFLLVPRGVSVERACIFGSPFFFWACPEESKTSASSTRRDTPLARPSSIA